MKLPLATGWASPFPVLPGPGHPDASAANPSSAATLDQESTAAAARNLSQLETGPKPGPRTWQQKPMGKKSSHQKGGKKNSPGGENLEIFSNEKKLKRTTFENLPKMEGHYWYHQMYLVESGWFCFSADRQTSDHHPPSLETDLMTTRRT